MPEAASALRYPFRSILQAVERFGEKSFWLGISSNFPFLNSPPFSSLKNPPQTPHARLQNEHLSSTMLDLRGGKIPSRSIVEKLLKKTVFQIVFLGQDEDQSVEVKEVEEINFKEVKVHVENGDSVFNTRRENEKLDIRSF